MQRPQPICVKLQLNYTGRTGGHQEAKLDLLNEAQARPGCINCLSHSVIQRDTIAVCLYQICNDPLASRLFGVILFHQMRGIFGHNQALPQVAGIKGGSVAQSVLFQRFGQDIQRQLAHFGAIKHRLRQPRPLRAKITGRKPQHIWRITGRERDTIQGHVKPCDLKKSLDFATFSGLG